MKVRDVMTRGVISVSPDTPVRKAAEMMLQYECSGMPVVDRGKLVGIVSEGDFLRRAETGSERRRSRWAEFFVGYGQLAAEYTHAHGRTVSEVMTKDVVTIGEDASLEEAADLMESHHVKRLPVVNGAAMVGIISRSNLLHAFVAAARKEGERPVGDAAIRERLEAELQGRAWAPGRSFRVEVDNGVVDLHGMIWDERQRAAIKVAAENIPGVKEVRDHLALVEPGTVA